MQVVENLHFVLEYVINDIRYVLQFSNTVPTDFQAMDKFGKFNIGQVVRHRHYPFRGVIFDVDPEFSNTEEWYEAIPAEIRPEKDQPFYHLLAENEMTSYVAYVSEQNLVCDADGGPVKHPAVPHIFGELQHGQYAVRPHRMH